MEIVFGLVFGLLIGMIVGFITFAVILNDGMNRLGLALGLTGVSEEREEDD